MDKFTFAKRVLTWASIITAVIVAVIGLCFGKVIEGNLLEEIGKWIVMGIGLVVLVDCLVIWPALTYYDHKYKDDGK